MGKVLILLLALPLLGAVVRAESGREKATFAGGCFWCMRPVFGQMNGVIGVVSGYAGGGKEDPTYEEVSSGMTGHREAVEVTYDPAKVKYADLLDVFWENVDPTNAGGQFADRGNQYKTAVFYHDDTQKAIAETYHQDYAEKNPAQYTLYKKGSGRESYFKKRTLTFLKSKS